MKQLIFISLLLTSILLKANEKKTYCEARAMSDTLYWYGFNFSLFKIVEPKLLNSAFVVKNEVCEELERTQYSQYNLGRIKILSKYPTIINKAKGMKGSYKNIDASYFIFDRPIAFNDSSIGKLLNGFETNGEGVGFIVIWESFNKFEESVSARYVFFNNSTKEILNETRIEASLVKKGRGQYGTLKHIYSRMALNYDKFYKKYKKEIKPCLK